MGKTFLRYLVTVFLFCFAFPVSAQKHVETQQLLWLRYYLKVRVSENLTLRQEIEERTYWFPWRQHQFVLRTMAEQNIGKGWSGGLGLTLFRHSAPQDPDVSEYTTITELRPLLALNYVQPISEKVSFHHRYWSEFRFFEQPDGNIQYQNNRTRYRFEVQYAAHPRILLKAFDEIHLNIGGNRNVFDQNRFGASFTYSFSRAAGIELGYIQWFQQQANGTDFYRRHILRCTILHSINLFDNKKQQG